MKVEIQVKYKRGKLSDLRLLKRVTLAFMGLAR